MIRSYGMRRMTKPEGMLRELHWPSMARMDERTGDGRLLMSSGAGTRELPRQASFQFEGLPGHMGAVGIGTLDQVIFHDDGNIEGWGWAADNEDGRKAVFAIATGMQRHNSIDLAEVKVNIDFDDDWNLLIDFTEWKIGKTTGVAMPAFADATIELTDELTASLYGTDEPLEMPPAFEITCDVLSGELTASASTVLAGWADFHIPESPEPHKIIVDADGLVYGSLAVWGEPHRGFVDRFVTAPRPTDGFAHFNHPGPLTERGQVGTGPVFFLGGHPKNQSMIGKSRDEVADAYGGVENAWADVRVSEGVHGPWISGRIRPGLSDEEIYRARASHISGHWVGDELVAIVSCNVPAFKPGAGFAHVADGKLLELVASFPAPPEDRMAAAPGADLERRIRQTMARVLVDDDD